MRRRSLIILIVFLTLSVIGVGGIHLAINRVIASRSGPVHRFTVPDTVLCDDRAVAIAREVMNRDGFAETAWKLAEDGRSKAPDGRPDRFLIRNTIDPNEGVVCFRCDDSPTPNRYVAIDLRDGEITARGTFGK